MDVQENEDLPIRLSGNLLDYPFMFPLSRRWWSTQGDFTVTDQPSSPIAAGSNDTFTIRFDPAASDDRAATVSIVNNDPNSNPYEFAIQGRGRSLPMVTTTEPSSIKATTAVSGGEVTSDGSAEATARGGCWSTTSNPTMADSHTIDGTGTFTSTMTGLKPNTIYDVRAYAADSELTYYGGAWTFTTKPATIAPETVLLFDEEEPELEPRLRQPFI
jgi:hypothetical protein